MENNYSEEIAQELIKAIQAGTAPWQRPWKVGEAMASAPYNAKTGQAYRGTNSIHLRNTGYADPRWLTYKQAQEMNAQVRRGEHGRTIIYAKHGEMRDKLDENGEVERDEEGKTLREFVPYKQAKIFTARVFNAEQIDGLPPLPPLEERMEQTAFQVNERVEAILRESNADIREQKSDRAYYNVTADCIVLPEREQFDDEAAFYATALHELGHWTGHPSRLDRNINNPFGSMEYAKEELRAEISAFMNAQRLGVSHDPAPHASYVDSWIKVLNDDPKEITRASADAMEICNFIDAFDRYNERLQEREQEHAQSTQTSVQQPEHEQPQLAKEKTYLAVPYAEKNEAKACGARWEKESKSWYLPQGGDLKSVQRWMPKNDHQPSTHLNHDPLAEFADALRDAGLDVHDVQADGKLHRVSVVGRPRGKDGAYILHGDGRPSGYIQNFVTGYKANWTSEGQGKLNQAELARQVSEMNAKRAQETLNRAREQQENAEKASVQFQQLPQADAAHPYLVAKGLTPDLIEKLDMRCDEKHNLVIPLRDAEGKIQSLQRIGGNGFKKFETGCKAHGGFAIIGGTSALQAQDQNEPIVISTGVATAASIHMATGEPVVVAFQDSNLLAVAEEFKAMYPYRSCFIVGDNDRHNLERGLQNGGLCSAQRAAQAVGGRYIVPQFTAAQRGKEFSDFNDLHRVAGLAAVKRQVQSGLAIARANVAEDQERLHAQEQSLERGEEQQEIRQQKIIEEPQHKRARRL